MCSLKGNKNAIKGNANFLRPRTHRRITALYLFPVCVVGLGKSALCACFAFCKMEIMSLTFVRHFKT